MIKTSLEKTHDIMLSNSMIDPGIFALRFQKIDTSLNYCEYSIIKVLDKKNIFTLYPYSIYKINNSFIIICTNNISVRYFESMDISSIDSIPNNYFAYYSEDYYLGYSPFIGIFQYNKRKNTAVLTYSFLYPISSVAKKYWPIAEYSYNPHFIIDSTNSLGGIPFNYLRGEGYSEEEINKIISGKIKYKVN